MAKITLRPDASLDAVERDLNRIGITLDRHPYPDGTYRVYVRKENMLRFQQYLNSQTKNESQIITNTHPAV